MERRLGYLRVSGELLQEAFMVPGRPDEWFQVQQGIPSDAKFIRMAIDDSHGRCDLTLVYEHSSFPIYCGNSMYRIPDPVMRSVVVTVEEVEEAHRRRMLPNVRPNNERFGPGFGGYIERDVRQSFIPAVADAILGEAAECRVVEGGE